MNISTTAAQLAAQNFAAGATQTPRSQPTPRRIETSDLVDLASKPEPVAKAPAALAVREPQPPVAAAVRQDTQAGWTGGRPARPGSKLDIRV